MSGDGRTLVHATIAALADLWNFHLARWLNAAGATCCPCCGWSGPGFLATWNRRRVTFQSRCPRCDSRSRHRGLYALLPRLAARWADGPVLFFAPGQPMLALLRGLVGESRVVTTDLLRSDVDCRHDIQKLGFADGVFAGLIRNHVLEHVRSDNLAIQECARVLRRGGIAVFTVPGDFHRYATVYYDKPDDQGHWRHYGMDLVTMLRAAFTSVEIVDLGALSESAWRVRRADYAFVAERG